jgi:acyl-CoA synthetase (AMP-forming)/AMP-acid ligase II
MSNIIHIAKTLKNGNIMEHFHAAAIMNSNRLAIADQHSQVTFDELRHKIENAHSLFMERGLKSGDRVLVFVPMSIDLYISVLALFQMGCTAVFIDEWAKIDRLKKSCQIADCKGFIGIPVAASLGFLIQEIRKIPIRMTTREIRHAKKSHFHDLVKIDSSNETALITFTTGSTGIPKAVKRSHEILHQQFLSLQNTIQTRDDTVDMPVLPIVLMINLGLGVSSVIVKWSSKKPYALKAKKIIKTIQQFRVNRIIASPYFIDQLCIKSLTENISPKLSSVREVFSGGAPVFPSEAKLWLTAFPDSKVEIVYGSTEAEPISSINARKLMQTTDSTFEDGLCVGKIESCTQVKILNLKTQETLKPGEIGEIAVAGNHVVKEYFGPDSAAQMAETKLLIDGQLFHKTGDSGYIDHQGNLHLLGRCQQIIEWQGQPLYPFLLEYQLRHIPGVIMGTVLKINDKLVYFLELNRCKSFQHLAYPKLGCFSPITEDLRSLGLPDGAIRLVKIPRDPRHFSKIDYRVLQKMQS